MPRVTHVNRAQQRYAVKPTIDPSTGEQKQVPVVDKRTGQQKTSKSGRPVFLKLTERDYDQPLPMPICDFCNEGIQVGTAYKWIEPHGSRVRNRHASCPTWNVWEYSSSLSARIAQIQSDSPDDFDSLEDAQSWASDKAQEIRDLAAEKQEAADNVESGFGHETEQSSELADIAQQLEDWADNLESVDLPEYPEAEEEDCGDCEGTGSIAQDGSDQQAEVGEDEQCPTCGGSGRATPDEPTEEQIDTWSEEVRDALQSVLDESPV